MRILLEGCTEIEALATVRKSSPLELDRLRPCGWQEAHPKVWPFALILRVDAGGRGPFLRLPMTRAKKPVG